MSLSGLEQRFLAFNYRIVVFTVVQSFKNRPSLWSKLKIRSTRYIFFGMSLKFADGRYILKCHSWIHLNVCIKVICVITCVLLPYCGSRCHRRRLFIISTEAVSGGAVQGRRRRLGGELEGGIPLPSRLGGLEEPPTFENAFSFSGQMASPVDLSPGALPHHGLCTRTPLRAQPLDQPP